MSGKAKEKEDKEERKKIETQILQLKEEVKSLKNELLLIEESRHEVVNTGIYWGSYAKWIYW